jgi:hypothetical protein
MSASNNMNIFEIWSRAKAARDHVERDIREKESREIMPELFTQAQNNVRYLRCYINTLRGNANSVQGATAAETKRKRDGAKDQLAWLERKLEEETVWAIHYGRLLGKTPII